MSAATEVPAWQADEPWLDRLPPLPTAEEIARPFVGVLHLLHDLAERAESLEHPASAVNDGWAGNNPQRLVEARHFVETVERAICLIRLSARTCEHERSGAEHDADALVRKLTLVDRLAMIVENDFMSSPVTLALDVLG